MYTSKPSENSSVLKKVANDATHSPSQNLLKTTGKDVSLLEKRGGSPVEMLTRA